MSGQRHELALAGRNRDLVETHAMRTVPESSRAAIRRELDALAAGERPHVMLWVHEYPAVLVRQPDDIWTHRLTDFKRREDGSAWAELPLWSTNESPSDLTASIEVSATGHVSIRDVRVQ